MIVDLEGAGVTQAMETGDAHLMRINTLGVAFSTVG